MYGVEQEIAPAELAEGENPGRTGRSRLREAHKREANAWEAQRPPPDQSVVPNPQLHVIDGMIVLCDDVHPGRPPGAAEIVQHGDAQGRQVPGEDSCACRTARSWAG